jgi:hypothetical protein
MNQQFSAPKNESIQETWSWPLRIDVYDKSPHLSTPTYFWLIQLFGEANVMMVKKYLRMSVLWILT